MISARPITTVGCGWTTALLVVACLQPAPAQQVVDQRPPAATTERATDRGLDWLMRAQQTDGSWGSGPFRGSAAVTAQVVMAAIATGSTPASGRHAAAIDRGVEYLLGCAGADGLIAGNEQAAHGPMYAHAFATTALAETYGEAEGDGRLAAVLAAARGLIDRTQNEEGGWRYQPRRQDADLSVTAAMLVAARALRDSGFAVSADTIARAGDFLAGLQNDDGGFRYLAAEGPSGSPRTAAALFALLVADRGDDEALGRGFAWLDAHPIGLDAGDGYALYGLSYEAAARWRWKDRHAGHGDGASDRWQAWYADVAARLVDAQNEDGSWSDPSCTDYGTAAAISILAMPRRLVPLFQPDGSDRDGRRP